MKYCVAFILMVVFLAGCTKTQVSQNTEAAKPRIALIMKSLANEFFLTMSEGAKVHHKKHSQDYDLIVNGTKDERDLEKQVSLVEQMIAEKVNAIVIAPADSKALVPVLARALKAGIAVVNIDNRLDKKILIKADVVIPFVGPDNREGAKLVGEVLAKKLLPKSKVAIIGGIPTAFNAQQRQQGFEDAMKKAGMEIVTIQSGEWEMGKANTVASAVLNEYPDIRALLCSNDNMALGAYAAVKAAGKMSQVEIVGFDNIKAVQELVKQGHILATADQHADLLAVFGINYALNILGGQSKTKDKQTPVDLITAESIKSRTPKSKS